MSASTGPYPIGGGGAGGADPARRRWRQWSLVVVIVAVVGAACSSRSDSRGDADTDGGGRAPTKAAETAVAFWAGHEVVSDEEFEPFAAPPQVYWLPRDTSAYTDELWDVLADHQVPLYLDLRYQRDFGPIPPDVPRPPADGRALVREANDRGIPVWAWMLVPTSDGFYAWEGNGELYREALPAFLDWAAENDLAFEGVALDLEPPIDQVRELARDPSSLINPPTPNPNSNPARQCAAIDVYAALIDDAHAAGITITAAAWPMVLDDLPDGLVALQDGLNVVTAPPLGWDALYFMAYTTEIARFFGDPGSGYVASYARSAREFFGPVGEISLGVAAVWPYERLENLVRDVRVLATLEMGVAPIFSLETTARAFGPDGVREVVEAAAQPFEGADADAMTEETPESLAIRDFFLDVDKKQVAATEGPQPPSRYPDGCEQTSRLTSERELAALSPAFAWAASGSNRGPADEKSFSLCPRGLRSALTCTCVDLIVQRDLGIARGPPQLVG